MATLAKTPKACPPKHDDIIWRDFPGVLIPESYWDARVKEVEPAVLKLYMDMADITEYHEMFKRQSALEKGVHEALLVSIISVRNAVLRRITTWSPDKIKNIIDGYMPTNLLQLADDLAPAIARYRRIGLDRSGLCLDPDVATSAANMLAYKQTVIALVRVLVWNYIHKTYEHSMRKVG